MNTLYDLDINKEAIIHSFNKVQDSSSRLHEMGLISGVIVRLVKKNPFGGPIQIKLNNNYIAIRKNDAEMINIILK